MKKKNSKMFKKSELTARCQRIKFSVKLKVAYTARSFAGINFAGSPGLEREYYIFLNYM